MKKMREMTLRELCESEVCMDIVKKHAPQMLKYPTKLFYRKKCDEIFDMVVKAKLLPLEAAQAIEADINALSD